MLPSKVVLLSGMCVRSDTVFHFLKENLSERGIETHHISLPGHEQIETMRPYSLSEYTDLVGHEVRQLRENIVLVGHSLGGRIAKHVAERNTQVQAVISICSAPIPGTPLSSTPVLRAFSHPRHIGIILKGGLFSLKFKEIKDLLLNGLPEKAQTDFFDSFVEESGVVLRELFLEYFGISRLPLHPSNIRCPIIEISMTHDRLCPPHFQRHIVRQCRKQKKRVQRFMLPGCHMELIKKTCASTIGEIISPYVTQATKLKVA